MIKLRTEIIPAEQRFVKNSKDRSLNLKAICIFAATCFFLEKDTYFNNLEALQPATDYELDENRYITDSKTYWEWNYIPRDISLKQATEEFAHLFEKLTNENLKGKKIILPLSGGLDSRTQAAAIENNSDINCYSYKFENSFDETKYGKEICRVRNFRFKELTIPGGYLWKVIDKLSEINNCYADFTHPRQMAVADQIKNLGDTFYLGHWGDVLFDEMTEDENISSEYQTEILFKKIIKRSGTELAGALWNHWGLDGEFTEYFKKRISELLGQIKIDNANSRIRAFKSMYWAPRWTSANMKVFSELHPVYLPYYDNEMCRFICTIPEHLLAGRQIQIEYIKMKNPELAKIPWQTYDPLNLYNYKNFEKKSGIPLRAYKKGKRIFREKILNKKLVTRNWEIQFNGKENEKHLENYLFHNDEFNKLVPHKIISGFYKKFREEDEVYYSHSVSMLLTLSVFAKKFIDADNG